MEFYVIINDEQKGPFTLDQLATLDITPSTEVWAEGMDDWQQAGDVPALTSLLQKLEYQRHEAAAAATVPPARAPRPVAPQQQSYVPNERAYTPPIPPQEPRRRNGGCLLWSAIVAIILIAVLVVTTPSREDHLNTIKDVTREWMSATIDDNGIGGSIFGEMAKWVGGSGVDLVINQMFTYDNYIVCSVGTLNYGTRSKHVSLGILGHVFTFDKDDINTAIKRALQGDDEPSESIIQQPDPEPEIIPEPQQEEEPQLQDEDTTREKSWNPAQDLVDTLAARAKREAVRAAKEWAKKKIDEM